MRLDTLNKRSDVTAAYWDQGFIERKADEKEAMDALVGCDRGVYVLVDRIIELLASPVRRQQSIEEITTQLLPEMRNYHSQMAMIDPVYAFSCSKAYVSHIRGHETQPNRDALGVMNEVCTVILELAAHQQHVATIITEVTV